MLDFTHAIGFGIVTAAILAIATVAVTMQYSVTNVPNFAIGDVMTAGAFAAFVTQFVVNNIVVQVACAMLVGGLISLFLNWGLLQPFARRGAKPLILFVVTIAFSLGLDPEGRGPSTPIPPGDSSRGERANTGRMCAPGSAPPPR
jgi:branched-subunit amino acid ABC-type transport system permease component